jgi:hypothetical protein
MWCITEHFDSGLWYCLFEIAPLLPTRWITDFVHPEWTLQSGWFMLVWSFPMLAEWFKSYCWNGLPPSLFFVNMSQHGFNFIFSKAEGWKSLILMLLLPVADMFSFRCWDYLDHRRSSDLLVWELESCQDFLLVVCFIISRGLLFSSRKSSWSLSALLFLVYFFSEHNCVYFNVYSIVLRAYRQSLAFGNKSTASKCLEIHLLDWSPTIILANLESFQPLRSPRPTIPCHLPPACMSS